MFGPLTPLVAFLFWAGVLVAVFGGLFPVAGTE